MRVLRVADNGFEECYDLEKVVFTVSDSIFEIGSYAFSYCESLSSINMPYSLEIIGYYAFDGCYSLGSVTIPNSVQYIFDYAFVENCTLYIERDIYLMYFNYDNYNVFANCWLSFDKSYLVAFYYTSTYLYSNQISGPTRDGYEFLGWSTTWTMEFGVLGLFEMTSGFISENTPLITVWGVLIE